jgi:uncharacterized RDD family membrane protein YckC
MTEAAAVAQRAGFFSRLAAFATDLVIVSAGIGGTAWFFEVTGRALGRFALPVDLPALVLAAAPVAEALYHVVFWATTGQTPGKWLLGIRVQRLGGGKVRPGQAVVRVLGYLLSALPLYAGFWWILGPERQGWHDRLARTEVVYNRPEPARTPPRRTLPALR